jgi:hypothetical protein
MKRALVGLSVFICLQIAFAQEPDPQLLTYIETIQAVDNHAHVLAPDVPDDKGYDALRCDPLPATQGLPAPANLRFGPLTQLTWKTLYGVVPQDAKEATDRHSQMTANIKQAHGPDYYPWVLDQSHVAVVLANRVAMTPALTNSRFRWVPYADALLFPLSNEGLKKANPDRNALFTMEDQLRQKYWTDAGVKSLPPTLDEYVNKVVRSTLTKQQQGGAVAIKFEVAYLRDLGFSSASHDAADAAYQRNLGSASPNESDYRVLQDYLFHQAVVEAGKLGLAVHIHTGAGCGESFNDAGSDPMLLSNAVNDPMLRGTNFVLLHGGNPFSRHLTSMIVKPNVYVDFSVIELEFSPQELARILRPWLEFMPEHVLYGTDADFFGPGMEWVEATWAGSHNARRALAIVLTEMVRDGTISMPRAREIAAMVLGENAARLYHLSLPGAAAGAKGN